MSKYINTEELNKAISKCKDEPFTKDTLYAITELLPSVELKHGEWIEEHEIQDYLVCPFCDVHFNMCDNDTEWFNYCPNCGADMRGDKDE